MPDLKLARTEIKRVETVLRSRYNYAHPVFDYLATALKALEGDLPKAAKSRRGKAKRAPKAAAEAPAEPEVMPEEEGKPTVESESTEGGRYEQ